MITVTENFKKSLKTKGKMISSIITCDDTKFAKKDIVSIDYSYDTELFKSFMRECDIEIIGYHDLKNKTLDDVQFGIKQKLSDEYEYISFGSFVVKEQKEVLDTESTMLECYDLMLKSMVEYDLSVVYPITVKDYLIKICERLNWDYDITNFVNSDKIILAERYDNTYLFRDVLDEIAKISLSNIGFKNDNKLHVIYPTTTGKTIDFNLRKFTVENKYGPINSLVLARTPQEDNVYRSDEDSIEDNGLTELKIENNQIADSDRDYFIADMFEYIDGLEYFPFQFESFGVCYLEVGDVVNILDPISKNIYSTIILKDNIQITQDLNEIVETKIPSVSETDYSKASQSDRVRNRTNLSVDKQLQEILASISKFQDFTGDAKGNGFVQVSDSYGVAIVSLKIGGYSITGRPLYPKLNLYPKSNLYPKVGSYEGNYLKELKIKVSNNAPDSNLGEIREYIYKLKEPLRSKDDIYDEFIIEGITDKNGVFTMVARVHRKLYRDGTGNVAILDTESIEELEYVPVILFEGLNYVWVENYKKSKIDMTYINNAEFNNYFSSKVQNDVELKLLKDEINLSVQQQTDSDNLIAKINLTPGKIDLTGTTTINNGFIIDENGRMTANGGTFNGDIVLNNGNRILSENGLLTSLIVLSNINSITFIGGSILLPMGFSGDARSVVTKDNLEFDFTIPKNFNVESAYVVLEHMPTNYVNSSYIGNTRNLRLFKGDNINAGQVRYDETAKILDFGNISFNEITGAFGNGGFTGSLSGLSEVTSMDIKDSITTSTTEDSFNLFKIETANPLPTTNDDIYLQTGSCKATLYIYGYSKFGLES